MIQYFENRAGSKDWRRIFAAEPPVRFLYRQSPRFLAANPDGYVHWQNPPPDLPGMVSAQLDSRGRLRQFEAVPPEYDQNGGAPQLFDPAPIFSLTGLHLRTFRL
jgi:hypothetical protein